MNSTSKLRSLTFLACASVCGSALSQPDPGSTPSVLAVLTAEMPDVHIAERGQDFAVCQRITPATNSEGVIHFNTNQWTLLENGLHFLNPETGTYEPSRDVIETFPEGAIARYGPMRAIFSHDLNAESVFDLEMPTGERLRGGVRAIELLDERNGGVVLATVKAHAPLELVPPNRLVARDAFDGIIADLILVWQHNRFSQSVLIREQPWIPEGFDPATTRLAVITEFVEAPKPQIPTAEGDSDDIGGPPDHLTIGFESASILMGHAFKLVTELRKSARVSDWVMRLRTLCRYKRPGMHRAMAARSLSRRSDWLKSSLYGRACPSKPAEAILLRAIGALHERIASRNDGQWRLQQLPTGRPVPSWISS